VPAPRPEPPADRTTPRLSSTRRASRTLARLTPSLSARSRSAGRGSPTVREPAMICSSTASMTSSYVFARDTGLHIGLAGASAPSDRCCRVSSLSSLTVSPTRPSCHAPPHAASCVLALLAFSRASRPDGGERPDGGKRPTVGTARRRQPSAGPFDAAHVSVLFSH